MVDEKLFKSALKVADRAGIHWLLRGAVNESRSSSWSNDWLKNAGEGWLFLNWADWAWLFVLYSGRLGNDRCLILHSDSDAELELRLSSTIELLVNRSIGWIEGYEGGGTVGITLEDSLGSWRDGEKKAQLMCGDELALNVVEGQWCSSSTSREAASLIGISES